MLSVVIKLLAAAAVATLTIVSLRRLSTASTPARPAVALPLALCQDIEQIDTKVLTKPRMRGNPPSLLEDFLRTYAEEHPDTYAGMWKDARGRPGRGARGGQVARP